jgi:VWFA-related protein
MQAWKVYNSAVKCAYVVAAALFCTFASAADKLNILNVAAIDSQGDPVTGLHVADFQLSKDGKPQTIAFFRFTGDQPVPLVKPGPNEYSNRAAAPLRATAIIIDLLNDRTMSGSVIADDVSRYLKNLESSQGLYLYILTVNGDLYPLHALPKPDSEVTPAGEPPAGEPWTRNITAMLQSAFKNVFGFKPVDDRDTVVRFDLTTHALLEIGSQLRLISGRKNLVWVTHGFPLNGPSISAQGIVDFTNPLRRICQQLERAQVVVYPAEQSMSGAAAAIGTESEQSLDEVAAITGGRRYRSGGLADAIRQATTDSRANYEIAYYSAEGKSEGKPDGKHHKLRVVSARKDVRLQTESAFNAVLPPVQASDVEQSAFLVAAHSPFDATEIGLRANVSSDPAARLDMRLDIRIDAADLLLRQAQDRRTGKVSIMFAAYSAAGLDQQGAPIPLNISLTPEQYETATHGGIEFKQAVRVGAGTRRVRVIVVDGDLGAVGSLTIPVQ